MIDAWRTIYRCSKSPFIWPQREEWKPTGDLKVLTTTVKLEIPLASADGSSIEGLALILEFLAVAPQDGAAILRYTPRSSYHLGRFDFGIAERHSNSVAMAGGVQELSKIVDGSHMHPFDLSAKLGPDAFRSTRNGPPAAMPIDDSNTAFRARMRLVGAEFAIEDLAEIPPPPYQGDLWR